MFNDGFANIDIPASEFPTVRKNVLDFYNKYYLGNLMTLTVVSNKPFEEVEEEIETHFANL